ncbi:synaptotagmin-12 [Octopus bimaculoides]|uniref:C2 domain-containing protein n=1 Tax=Octopus bimaculoides TaxID=37653 RepID=A0A0L8IHN7_OCTBM|nr:synaptotagmin-12 [Octopus bimaculoides]XP_014775582.1 synaptotagmin-12 [Octopus bimaculoides]|eukprot:XP_014775501.1 PREDICTED: synaptotagmin-12-like [Octopus bimaculoides]
MSDWGVIVLVVIVIGALAGGIAMLLRLYGIYNLTSCFAYGEEKAVLTKNEHYNGYMVSSENDFVLDTSGKFVQYDTLQSDPKYMNMANDSPPREEQSPGGSPSSQPSTSVASDFELGHGIKRAESCESVASDCSVFDMQPDMPKIGQLEFAIEYDREVAELVLSIIQAKDLEPNQFTGSLDTYIRVMMLGDRTTKFSTKVQKNTTDPVYKERFLFNVESTHLESKIIQFQVFSVDKYARHKVIGESEIKMGDIDLRVPIKMWLNLRDLDERHAEFGDILFSLSYLPTAERLTIVIVKARNLKWMTSKDIGDPFVKVYLLQNGKKINKKRTTVKRSETNPIFNEAMIFSVPASALSTVQLRITVAEVMSDNRTPSLGHVIVGNSTSGTELSHWNQMMTSLRKPVAMWHNLRK